MKRSGATSRVGSYQPSVLHGRDVNMEHGTRMLCSEGVRTRCVWLTLSCLLLLAAGTWCATATSTTSPRCWPCCRRGTRRTAGAGSTTPIGPEAALTRASLTAATSRPSSERLTSCRGWGEAWVGGSGWGEMGGERWGPVEKFWEGRGWGTQKNMMKRHQAALLLGHI